MSNVNTQNRNLKITIGYRTIQQQQQQQQQQRNETKETKMKSDNTLQTKPKPTEQRQAKQGWSGGWTKLYKI